uniref:mediator of RNA polymerase II transcription subunit 31 n=1 Tax=Callithrix jacchus TaxID=9483 RepID=UPI0023DD65E3|nr:mediator of RNA polymerase II transcription subunit 31 [Callithrix jacchus]
MMWKHHCPSKAKTLGFCPSGAPTALSPPPRRSVASGDGAARGWAEPPGRISHNAPGPEEGAVVFGTSLATPGVCSVGLVAGWCVFVMAAAVAMETDDAGNRLRFQLELEFVQCLANPNYLNFLAQRGYFKDKAFVNYLKYLLYWKDPEYAKYLKYPQCLHMLELLQYEHFRKELVNAQCAKFIDEQQILHWQHYSRKRMRLQQALAEQQQQNNTSGK